MRYCLFRYRISYYPYCRIKLIKLLKSVTVGNVGAASHLVPAVVEQITDRNCIYRVTDHINLWPACPGQTTPPAPTCSPSFYLSKDKMSLPDYKRSGKQPSVAIRVRKYCFNTIAWIFKWNFLNPNDTMTLYWTSAGRLDNREDDNFCFRLYYGPHELFSLILYIIIGSESLFHNLNWYVNRHSTTNSIQIPGNLACRDTQWKIINLNITSLNPPNHFTLSLGWTVRVN